MCAYGGDAVVSSLRPSSTFPGPKQAGCRAGQRKRHEKWRERKINKKKQTGKKNRRKRDSNKSENRYI
jgi:hypothetical protein